jgi:sugar diacid utilization regulator
MNREIRVSNPVETEKFGADDGSIQEIARRISRREEQVARTMVERYRAEMLDYAALDDRDLYGDVREVSLLNLRALLANLDGGRILHPEELERFRASAVRRVHEGISLESLLHAYRLWAQILWQTVLETAARDVPAEREAALRIAGRLIEHVDVVSTASAQAYLDEAQGVWSDREVLRRDLLEALVSGRADEPETRQQAAALGIDLAAGYAVVVARRSEPSLEALAVRATLRHAVETLRRHLQPVRGTVLFGLRQEEVIALYPAAEAADIEPLRGQCEELATGLAAERFSIGLGTRQPGAAGIAQSYREASEAAEVALGTGTFGAPIAFEDVLLDSIMRSSPHATRLLAASLEPLREYDARRGASLVDTLRAYFQSGFNLTRSAEKLHVHPNTVVYRLRRVAELTGRDPQNPNDLLLLSLGVRMSGGAG